MWNCTNVDVNSVTHYKNCITCICWPFVSIERSCRASRFSGRFRWPPTQCADSGMRADYVGWSTTYCLSLWGFGTRWKNHQDRRIAASCEKYVLWELYQLLVYCRLQITENRRDIEPLRNAKLSLGKPCMSEQPMYQMVPNKGQFPRETQPAPNYYEMPSPDNMGSNRT